MEIDKIKPHERQVVFFIADDEYGGLQHTDDGKELLSDSEVVVIPLSESDKFLDSFQVVGGALPTNRMMLLISPNNPSVYSEVAESNAAFALEKLANITRLCQLIGAKKVQVVDIYEENNINSTKTETKGTYTVSSGSLETDNKSKDQLKKQIGLVSTYSGGKGNYEKAKAFLRKSRMGGDPFLNALVEMHDPEYADNTLTSTSQKLSLNSSSEKTFELLANLKIPVGGGNFKMNTQQISKKEYVLEIKIEF